MHRLRARRVRRLRGPAALQVLNKCRNEFHEENEVPGSAVHRLQPPGMLQSRVQDLLAVPRFDVPRRRSMRRGHPASADEAAAEFRRREGAFPMRALHVSPMPEVPEGNAQRRM